MARFSFKLLRAAQSATIDVGSVINAAASPRRFQLYDLMVGSDATPADNASLWEVQKRTGTATAGSSVTGQPLDDSDTIPSTLVGNQAPTVNGAGSGVKLSIPLNQRATFRWVAAPGSEIVSPATTSNGYGIATPTAQGTVQGVATVLVNEL
jgi:hypothetical protein